MLRDESAIQGLLVVQLNLIDVRQKWWERYVQHFLAISSLNQRLQFRLIPLPEICLEELHSCMTSCLGQRRLYFMIQNQLIVYSVMLERLNNVGLQCNG